MGACLLASPLVVGCAKKKPSAIVVSLSSEAPVPEELDQMEILVQRGDDTKHLGQYTLDVSKNGDTRLPGTLTLQKEDGEDATSPVTITVTASSGAKKRVLRRATLGFSDEKTKLLKMPLRYSCFDFKELCSATEECLGGVCQSVAVDVETLPEYDDKLVFGTTADRSCFDDGDSGCFAGATTIEAPSALLADGADGACTLALGAAARGGAGLNVGLRWSASGSLGRFATLEREAGRLSEGFSHDGNGTLQLPKGLCSAIKDGRVTAVRFSTSCATKAETQPLCVFQEDVCKVEKKAATLATSACFQCMYAPSSPKNCAALLDEARCDDASRGYLACLLDTPFSDFSKSAECPEPRRQACASQLGDCATSLNSAACQEKLSKLLAYVACADEVNGGLADDGTADLAAALARCNDVCTKEGYVKGCTSGAPTAYVAPLPLGTYGDGKGNTLAVTSASVTLGFGGTGSIELLTSAATVTGDPTITRYDAKITKASTLTTSPTGWPTAPDATPQTGGKLWVSLVGGSAHVDLTQPLATAPGSGFNAAGPFSIGTEPTGPCATATTKKTVFCFGPDLVTCDPQTKQITNTQGCPNGCGSMAVDANDACLAAAGPMCGDGVVDTDETCDDKNTKNGDGCSVSCTVEPDYLCKGEPSACSQPSDACGACAAQTACAQVACSVAPCPTCMFQFFSGAQLDSACMTNTQFLIFKACACGAACFVPCMTSCG